MRIRLPPFRRCWPGGIRELLLCQVGKEYGQGPVQHLGFVARRIRMPEHVLREAQLLDRLPADRELKLVTARRQRLHNGRTVPLEG